MRVLLAPDKFKGTFDAVEVAGLLAAGVVAAGGQPTALPVADGGDGTAAILLDALGGRAVTVAVTDALGRPICARFALLADGRAVVDVAEASGLRQLDPNQLDAVGATTRGTGELIAAAIAHGAREVLVAAGGSATTDAGAGALAVLRALGRPVPPLTVLCDVDVEFDQAVWSYAAQKGATAQDRELLAGRLDQFAAAAPRDPRGRPLAGSAGGLAGGLWAHLDARLVVGSTFVLDAVGADVRIAAADLVITGEGRLDEQTAHGKVVAAVAAAACRHDVPVHAVVGQDALGDAGSRALGLASVREAGTPAALRTAGQVLSRRP